MHHAYVLIERCSQCGVRRETDPTPYPQGKPWASEVALRDAGGTIPQVHLCSSSLRGLWQAVGSRLTNPDPAVRKP